MTPNVCPSISVIVPARNEATYLPRLLDALGAQTCAPAEIIVADGGSFDDTARVATDAGCIVVEGGTPAAGRNHGAAVATGEVLVFMDADTLPGPTYLADALEQFTAGGFDVAGVQVEAIEQHRGYRAAVAFVNWGVRFTASWNPHAPGCCIIATCDAHRRLGGFDEMTERAEDHDYARRARALGKFGVLDCRIPVSMRRVERVGLAATIIEYTSSELQILLGGKVRKSPFDTEIEMHEPVRSAPRAASKGSPDSV